MLSKQTKTAAEIEAEQDKAIRNETKQPFCETEPKAPAAEVKCLTSRMEQLQRTVAQLAGEVSAVVQVDNETRSMLNALLKHTGFQDSDDETLVETVHTNAEHISDCLKAFNRRISDLEANRLPTARPMPTFLERVSNVFWPVRPDDLPEDDIPF